MVGSTEAVYQLPGSRHAYVVPKGLIFLAHGCSHAAIDWWPSTPTCPSCIGLPVEMSIVSAALNSGFAVIAVSSSSREHKCWSPADMNPSIAIVKSFYTNKLKNNLSIPLYLLGVSSGGSFVGFLAQSHYLVPKPSAVCVQISAVHVVKPMFLAPTLFVAMARDSSLLHRVTQLTHSLSSSKVLTAQPLPIHSAFFHEQTAGTISLQTSALLANALTDAGLLDKARMLATDPRASSWRQAVLQAVPDIADTDSLKADQSSISELLNMAYAQHEISSHFNKEVMDWFLAHTEPAVF